MNARDGWEMTRQHVKRIILESFLSDWALRWQLKRELRNWEREGRIGPRPNLLKQKDVKECAREFQLRTMVESGTYHGAMVSATKDIFSRIVSIELDKTLYERAKKKFSRYGHISILQGDSGEVLGNLLPTITEPCLFWLDAHYSGGPTAKGRIETPILQELHHVLHHPVAGHVILIDDAHCFVGQNDYPTIKDVRELVLGLHSDWVVEVKDDMIHLHGRRSSSNSSTLVNG
ncbi:MAG: hypothetical protein ABSA70_03905 [Terriglobia bacterium]